jgi:SsrA-binding protein
MSQIAKNKRAIFDYEIKDTFDAGLVLSGPEVKSAKSGNVSMAGSYVTVNKDGANLVSAHIGPYKYAPNENYNPTRTRQLLLNKTELNALVGKEKGLTIIPLEIFDTKRGLIKVRIALGRPRKKQDKRDYLKKREDTKEIKNA